MSQVSSRLGETELGTLTGWTITRPVANEIISSQRSKGRAHLRRLFISDLLIVGAVAGLPAVAVAQSSALGLLATGNTAYYAIAGLLLALAWMASLRLFKTQTIGTVAAGLQEYKFVLKAWAALAGGLGVTIGLTGQHSLRIFLIYSLPLGLSALLASRWTWRQWLIRQSRNGYALSNVLLYGQAVDVPFALRQISKCTSQAYRVVGVVVDGQSEPEAQVDIRAADPTLPVIFGSESLHTEAARLNADSIIVAGPLTGGNEALQHLGWNLESTGTKLIVASSLIGIADRRVRTSPLDGMALHHVEPARFTGVRYFLKRCFDVLFSSLVLLALAPIFALIALLIRRDGPGKIFFLQERAGQDGRPFKMFKFRTMIEDAEAQLATLQEQNEGSGPLFKLKNDPRVTRCGKWLRKHSLDELPQFLNVLRGEMSVVGPRPPLFTEVDKYQGHTNRRLLLKPGVTGLWQVSGRSNLSWQESIRLDLYYAENWTVCSDLRIIWRTLSVMLKPEGAY